MKVTALAITSILFILAIAWKMSDGPNDATIHEQTDISALLPASKIDVAKESQSESVSRVTDTNKTTEIYRIDSTSSIETQYPDKEDALSAESQKVYTELEADVMAIVNAVMQNPHLANGENIAGIVTVEADMARIIIERFNEGNLMRHIDEVFGDNAWELSLPSETDMHFEKEIGMYVEISDKVTKIALTYE